MSLSLLKKVSLFLGVAEKDLKEILKLTSSRQFKKDKVIILESDKAGDKFYVINKGKVKVTRMNEHGKEVVLTILGKGDFFGEMSLLDGLSRSASVFALDNVELLTVKAKNFIEMLNKYPQMSLNLTKVFCARLRRSDSQIKRLSLMNTIGKVASTLLSLAESNKKKGNKTADIDKLPTLQNLANMAGTSKSSVSNVLNSLIKSGYIKREGNKVTIKNYAEFENIFF